MDLGMIGQPSDEVVYHARWGGWRMSFAGARRERNSVNRDIGEDYQQICAGGDGDVVRQQYTGIGCADHVSTASLHPLNRSAHLHVSRGRPQPSYLRKHPVTRCVLGPRSRTTSPD